MSRQSASAMTGRDVLEVLKLQLETYGDHAMCPTPWRRVDVRSSHRAVIRLKDGRDFELFVREVK